MKGGETIFWGYLLLEERRKGKKEKRRKRKKEKRVLPPLPLFLRLLSPSPLLFPPPIKQWCRPSFPKTHK